MKKREIVSFLYIFISTILVAHQLVNTSAAQDSSVAKKQLIRVYFPDRVLGSQIFISFEPAILEANYDEGYYIMQVTDEDLDRIIDAGLVYEFDDLWQPEPRASALLDATDATIPGYPCYETVEETYAEAEAMSVQYPQLVDWIDAGDSWERSADIGGYDMMVLLLTNKNIITQKPKLFLTCSIHAREYATAPLCLEFARHLVNNYMLDPDATWILDHHEIHIMLHANPDGRKQAETGVMWRKNTNLNYCIDSSADRGADLNRNFAFNWGCCGGSSPDECNTVFRGPQAASEPETQAIQNYMIGIFPDQRGASENDPAPDDSTGIFIDVHSFSELVLWPWGNTANPAPNGQELQTLGRRLAFWNGYLPEQSMSLYPTDGTTIDFCYGELGVPSFTIEIGTTFFQDCTTYYNEILPDNIPVLLYAAKVARTPYITPSGPNVHDLAIDTNYVSAGEPINLTAIVDDTQYNNSNGTQPTQNIQAVEYYVDTPFWSSDPAPIAIPMLPTDGSFDSQTENVEAMVDTSGWDSGQHILFIRGQDLDGVWGAVSAIFLYIGDKHCIDDSGCDDGLFCNGIETCNLVDLTCEIGTDPCAGTTCDETNDMCGCLDDSECDDGVFCNGAETCVAGSCQPGAPVDCDDAIACTYETCDEASAACLYYPDHQSCDDGNECTQDSCSVGSGCQYQLIPNCGACISFYETITQHQNQQRVYSQTEQDCSSCWFGCVFPFGCAYDVTRYFAVGSNQDLGTNGSAWITLYSEDQGASWSTTECAQPNCIQDADCQDGLYCNGQEQCVDGFCQVGVAVNCDDSVGCTQDSCNESTDSCDHIPDDALCIDAQFCNGQEYCDATYDCQPGTYPCGERTCDESQDICGCLDDVECSDGVFCNGQEICSSGSCQSGTAIDCDDGIACTVDACVESTQSCQVTPDHTYCDDSDSCTTDICTTDLGCSNEPIVDCTQCLPSGTSCASNDECCSGSCRGFWIFRWCA